MTSSNSILNRHGGLTATATASNTNSASPVVMGASLGEGVGNV